MLLKTTIEFDRESDLEASRVMRRLELDQIEEADIVRKAHGRVATDAQSFGAVSRRISAASETLTVATC